MRTHLEILSDFDKIERKIPVWDLFFDSNEFLRSIKKQEGQRDSIQRIIDACNTCYAFEDNRLAIASACVNISTSHYLIDGNKRTACEAFLYALDGKEVDIVRLCNIIALLSAKIISRDRAKKELLLISFAL